MPVRYRRFGVEEIEAVGKVHARAFNAFMATIGGAPLVDVDNAEEWTRSWDRNRKSVFHHMTASEGESWLAEHDGEIVGYARSLLRDGVRNLTDFFVLPGQQTNGIGKTLLDRAFSPQGVDGRVVISTTDAAAQVRYLKSGMVPRCPICDFQRPAEQVRFDTDLSIEQIIGSPQTFDTLSRIDRTVVGYGRDADHAWLLGDRNGYVYRRDGKPVGYGYVGRRAGPFAILNPDDFPAVLAHAESETAAARSDLTLMVPLVNSTAVNHLLSRGFHMDGLSLTLLMSDAPRGQLDRYVVGAPGFFV
jgi:hypothetical protein